MPIDAEFVTKKIANQLDHRLRSVEYEQSIHFVGLQKECARLKNEVEKATQQADNISRRLADTEGCIQNLANAPAPETDTSILRKVNERLTRENEALDRRVTSLEKELETPKRTRTYTRKSALEGLRL